MKKRRLNALTPATAASDKHLPAFASQEEYERQLMVELSNTRLEKYSSEVLTKNLKVAVEHTKTAKKEEVIVHSKRSSGQEVEVRKRRLSFFTAAFEGTSGPIEINWSPCARHRSSTYAPPSRSTTRSARASSTTSRRTRTQSPPSSSNSPSTRRNSAPKDSPNTRSGDLPFHALPYRPLSTAYHPGVLMLVLHRPPLPSSTPAFPFPSPSPSRWIIFIDGGAAAAYRGISHR